MRKHPKIIGKTGVLAALVLSAFVAGISLSNGVLARQETPLDQLFTIRAIAVDETARSSNQARQTAILKAEEEAYVKLLRKITQLEDRALLPDLRPAERQGLISGIEFVEEQSSSRRYVATLNVRFEPSRVSALLASYNVPHVLGTGRPILVIHAHKRGLATILWERDALVERGRMSVDWVNRIRGYRFARGEIRERLAISAADVRDFELEAAAEVGKLNDLESSVVISSETVNSAREGQILTYRYFATDSGVAGDGKIAIVDGREDVALSAMYEDILEIIDGAWRERLLVDTGSQGELSVLVASRNLEDLAETERRLGEVALVQAYQLTAVGIPLSKFHLTYTGRPDQLALALRFEGLDLKDYGDQLMIELRQ